MSFYKISNYTHEPCGSTVKSLTTGTETITYGHDGPLVTSVAQTGTLNQTVSLAYNSDFKVKTLTYAGTANAYTFDNDNLLTGSGAYTIARNSQNGLPTSVTGNGLSEGRTFNQYGELDAWTVTVGGSAAASYALTRDAAGNIASRTETVAGASHEYAYVYDNVGRLTQVTKDGVVVESYAYAGPGTGRTSETNTLRGLANRAYAYDAEDHLTSAGQAGYTYDLDGFLTGKTVGAATTQYQYSSRGELLRVDLPSGGVVEYAHDPLGRRIAKKVGGTVVEKYLWQGRTKLLAVYDGNGSLKQRFEYADGRLPVAMTVGGTRYFLVYDQVGSLRAVVDSAGAAVKTVEYDSFGNVIADSNSAFAVPFGFAGGLFDTDTGLTRFGFRDYDAAVGRWTAKDPILFEGGDTDLYGYVVGDPVNLVDPKGEFAFVAALPVVVDALVSAAGVTAGVIAGSSLGQALSDSIFSAKRLPPGSLPIDKTPWSGDHGKIKDALNLGGKDKTFIAPGDEGDEVVTLNPDGSYENHGPASAFTAKGKPGGRRGKDRGSRDDSGQGKDKGSSKCHIEELK